MELRVWTCSRIKYKWIYVSVILILWLVVQSEGQRFNQRYDRRPQRVDARRGRFRQRSEFSGRRAQPFNNRRYSGQQRTTNNDAYQRARERRERIEQLRRQQNHLTNKIRMQNQVLQEELSTVRNEGRRIRVEPTNVPARHTQRNIIQARGRQINDRNNFVQRQRTRPVQNNIRRQEPAHVTQTNIQKPEVQYRPRQDVPRIVEQPVRRLHHFKPFNPDLFNAINARIVQHNNGRGKDTVVIRKGGERNLNRAPIAPEPNFDVSTAGLNRAPIAPVTNLDISTAGLNRAPIARATNLDVSTAGLNVQDIALNSFQNMLLSDQTPSINTVPDPAPSAIPQTITTDNGPMQVVSKSTAQNGTTILHVVPATQPAAAPTAQSKFPVSPLGSQLQQVLDLSTGNTLNSLAVPQTNIHRRISPLQTWMQHMFLGGESPDSPDVPDPTDAAITTTMAELTKLLTSQALNPTQASITPVEEEEEIEWEDLPPTTTTTTTTTTTPRPTTTTTTQPTTTASTIVKSIAERIVALLLAQSASVDNGVVASETADILPEVAKLPMKMVSVKPTLPSPTTNSKLLTAKTNKNTIIIVRNGSGKSAKAIAIPKRALIKILNARRKSPRKKMQSGIKRQRKVASIPTQSRQRKISTFQKPSNVKHRSFNLDDVVLSDSFSGSRDVALSPYVAGNDLGGISVQKIKKQETKPAVADLLGSSYMAESNLGGITVQKIKKQETKPAMSDLLGSSIRDILKIDQTPRKPSIGVNEGVVRGVQKIMAKKQETSANVPVQSATADTGATKQKFAQPSAPQSKEPSPQTQSKEPSPQTQSKEPSPQTLSNEPSPQTLSKEPSPQTQSKEPSTVEILLSLKKLIEAQQTTAAPTTTPMTTTMAPLPPTTTTAAPVCTPKSPNFQCKGKDLFATMDSISAWCLGMCVSTGCIKSVCKCGCDVNPTQPSPLNMARIRQQQMLTAYGRPPPWAMTTQQPVTTDEPPEADEFEAEDMTTTQSPPARPWWAMPFPNSPSPQNDFTLSPIDTHSSNVQPSNKHVNQLQEIAWASQVKERLKVLAANAAGSTTPSPSKRVPDWQGTPWHLPVPPSAPPKQASNESPPTLSESFPWNPSPPNLRSIWGRSNPFGGGSGNASPHGMFWGARSPWGGGGGGGMNSRFSGLRFNWGRSSSGGGEEEADR